MEYLEGGQSFCCPDTCEGVGIFLHTESELERAAQAGLLRSRKLTLREVKGFIQGCKPANGKARAACRLPSHLTAPHHGTAQHASGLRAKGKNLVRLGHRTFPQELGLLGTYKSDFLKKALVKSNLCKILPVTWTFDAVLRPEGL